MSALLAIVSVTACDPGPRAASDAAPASSTAASSPGPRKSRHTEWPKGPFAHNCLRANADAPGDFDGDGAGDLARFFPAARSNGAVTWKIRIRFASGRTSSGRVTADCPEAIGTADIDGDGHAELFYDTGRGMTAALVDVLRYREGRLRNLRHVPLVGSYIYVGGSNAGRSDLTCFRGEGQAGVVSVQNSRPGRRLGLVRRFAMTRRRLVVVDEERGRLDGVPSGRLTCFGLRWRGY